MCIKFKTLISSLLTELPKCKYIRYIIYFCHLDNRQHVWRVKGYIEEHLSFFSTHKSVKPIWCKTCSCLIKYEVEIDYDKMDKRDWKRDV